MRLIEKYFGCPYCGSRRDEDDHQGCCGESSAHFRNMYAWKDTDNPIEEDELEDAIKSGGVIDE